MKRGISAGMVSRSAAATSRVRRVRFSSEPPQRSARRLLSGGRDECHDHVEDAGLVEVLRQRVRVVKRNRTGRDHGPGALLRRQSRAAVKGRSATRLASRVRELDGGNGAHPFDKSGYAGERLDVAILVNAHIAGRDAPLRGDGAGFDEHERSSAGGAAAEMNQMPIVGESVNGRILAHGGYDDSVAQRVAANRKRIEKGH
jgi:hypothetical protein